MDGTIFCGVCSPAELISLFYLFNFFYPNFLHYIPSISEEMSHLYLPWGSGERYTNRLQVRNQFASTLELHKESSYNYQEPPQRQRSPSLPPIHHAEVDRSKEEKRTKEVINRNIPSAKRFTFYDEDGEGDTSGYGSETVNHIRNGFHDVNSSRSPVMAWQQEDTDKR